MNNSKSTAKELIEQSAQLLKRKGVDNPKLNAELIMAHCMNTNRIELYSKYYMKVLSPIEINFFKTLIQRRLGREPLQYITGRCEFMSLPFCVNSHVLIPRPDTEILVEKALNYCIENRKKGFKVLDVGTGSGNIVISIAKYCGRASYFATDISQRTLRTAKKNAKLNGVAEHIDFISGWGFEPFSQRMKFDCIVANPPYIPSAVVDKLQREVRDFEPRAALDGGEDGFDMIRYLLDNAHKHLKRNGLFAFEMGEGQNRYIRSYAMNTDKYRNIRIIKDLSGIARVAMMVKK